MYTPFFLVMGIGIFGLMVWTLARRLNTRHHDLAEHARLSRRYRLNEMRAADEAYQAVESTVRIWGLFIEKHGPDVLEIRDERELPFPKEKIERACLVAISVSSRTPEFQNAVAATLLKLAHFQPGIGSRPLQNPVLKIAAGFKNQKNSDVRSTAEALISADTSSQLQKFEENYGKVELEHRRLLRLAEAAKNSGSS
jgi:hypothetical protein